MIVSALKPSHLQRYKDVGMLLLKFGQTDLIEKTGLQDFLSPNIAADGRTEKAEDANQLVGELERLSPAFAELGQILSLRSDLFTDSYTEALSSAGEHEEEALPYLQIKEIIDAELNSQAGTLQSIDEKPAQLSALSQSHKARLKNGAPVMIKVQRPGMREKIFDDLDALREVAQFCDEHIQAGNNLDLAASFAEINKLILSELDFKQTASDLTLFKTQMKDIAGMVIPQAIEEYCSTHILTTEYIDGRPLTAIGVGGLLNSERKKLAEALIHASFKQALIDGLIATRLSSNNIVISKSGQLALLNSAPFIRLTHSTQEKLIQLLLSVKEGKTEHAAYELISLSKKADGFDEMNLRRKVEEVILQRHNAASTKRGIGGTLAGLCRACIEAGLKIEPAVPLAAGALYKAECSAHLLDAKFDAAGYLEHHLSELARGRVAKTFSSQNLFHNAVAMAELIEQMPGKVSRILDTIATNNLKVTVHAIDEAVLIKGFQKIANRIALALVLAALIMGAAQLMQVRTSFMIWGYPGLAMLCFIAAAVFGFTLVVEIMISDRH